MLRGLSTSAKLRERVRLLESSHEAVFFRNMSNRIYFWNKAAEELYGFTGEEADGKVPHELLGTVFPEPFEKISAKLHASGRWDGELVHTRKDGEQVIVASRWSLHRDQNAFFTAGISARGFLDSRPRDAISVGFASGRFSDVTCARPSGKGNCRGPWEVRAMRPLSKRLTASISRTAQSSFSPTFNTSCIRVVRAM